MGYTTNFEGTLNFSDSVTVGEVRKVKSIIDGETSSAGHYIDLEIVKDFTGIKWNGAEKTYGMEETVTFIINEVRKEFPEFTLAGELMAQGEEVSDRWRLCIVDGKASRVESMIKGKKVTCPTCECEFVVED